MHDYTEKIHKTVRPQEMNREHWNSSWSSEKLLDSKDIKQL